MQKETNASKASFPVGGIWHPFSRAYYHECAPGRVKVTIANGSYGIFDGIGRWIEGEVFEADPEMCLWISTTRNPVSHRLSTQHGSQEPTK